MYLMSISSSDISLEGRVEGMGLRTSSVNKGQDRGPSISRRPAFMALAKPRKLAPALAMYGP